MAEVTLEKVKEWIDLEVGDEFDVDKLRVTHEVDPKSSNFYKSINTLVAKKYIKRIAYKRYRKVRQVSPIKVFGRERRPPINLRFPVNHTTGKQIGLFDDVVIREGDLIVVSGFTNQGKTLICLSFAGENIDMHPILMGNEYTQFTEEGDEPSPRFLNRLDGMDWIEWVNGDGKEKFTLLPVRDDYAEHIERDKLNVIDWINLPGEYNMIGRLMENIQKEVGRGIIIASLQKNPDAKHGMGGPGTAHFAALELLLDNFNKNEVMMTVGKVKEPKPGRISPTGRKFVYFIEDGVKITRFREVFKCGECNGYKIKNGKTCGECNGTGYTEADEDVLKAIRMSR